MFVAYTVKIHGIIECWQCYGVCEVYNGVVSKVLGDGWLNPRILSVQSLEAHHRPPVPRSQCVCRLCLSEVEDEEHALLYYNGSQYLEDLRSDFFNLFS